MSAYALVLFLVVLLLGGQLAQLQINEHASLAAAASANAIRGLPLPAPRGAIVDRNGALLAGNRAAFAATYFHFGSPPPRSEQMALEAALAMSPAEMAQVVGQINQQPSNPIVVKGNLTPLEITRVAQTLAKLPGVSLVPMAVRDYPLGSIAAPFLGYVTPVLNTTGLEQQYASSLVGQPGAQEVEVNVAGQPVRQLQTRPPVPGDTLVLSIDRGLQMVAYHALQADMARIRRMFSQPADAGGMVVMNVHTGQILAMVSVPSYNPNFFAQGITSAQYAQYANPPVGTPSSLLNYVTQAVDPPGSDFKMAIAVAALKSRRITPQSEFYGYAVFPSPPYPRNWTYPSSTGWNNLVDAIAQSCDSYFYAVGHLTGFDTMMYWARQLGFGAPTGIDLPGEVSFRLPTRQNYPGGFYPSVDYSLAIGQGAIAVTPLQLVDYTAVLANGGALLRPSLVDRIISPSGHVVYRAHPFVRDRIDLPASDWQAIRSGMHGVTLPPWAPGGSAYDTAWSMFTGFPMAVAGKTGTAQVSNHSSTYDTYFVSFAPYHNPQIAVLAFVHHGEEGADTAWAVRDVYDYYFHLKDPTNPMPVPGLPKPSLSSHK